MIIFTKDIAEASKKLFYVKVFLNLKLIKINKKINRIFSIQIAICFAIITQKLF